MYIGNTSQSLIVEFRSIPCDRLLPLFLAGFFINLTSIVMKLSCNAPFLTLSITLLFAGCIKKDIVPTEDSLSLTVASEATTPDFSKCKLRTIYQDAFGDTV